MTSKTQRALEARLDALGRYERVRWWRQCKDGWLIGYTTTRLVGGSHPGHFAVVGYRRRGEYMEIAYVRVYRLRRDARSKSVQLWTTHEAKGARR